MDRDWGPDGITTKRLCWTLATSDGSDLGKLDPSALCASAGSQGGVDNGA